MINSAGRLAGKTVLVTGVASGIGAASACLFAENGASVLGFDLPTEAEVESVRAIRAGGGQVLYRQVDVTDTDATEAAVQAGVEHFGRLDGLFNCVGIVSRIPALECSMEEWNRVIAVTLTSQFVVSKAAIAHMRQNPAGGSIVSMASNVAVVGMRNIPAYSAAKGGVTALTRQLAADYGWDRIRVNCLAPGPVDDTGMFRSRADPEAAREKTRSTVPLVNGFGRLMQPRDIGNIALFLLSDDSWMISGVTLVVDGAFLPMS